MSRQRSKTKDIQDFLLAKIDQNSNDITAIAASKFNISKQAVRKHIQKLIKNKLVIAYGKTRNRRYELLPLDEFVIKLPISPILEEDKIWRLQVLPKIERVNPNVVYICQYGFTEIVNNVVDHSGGQELTIQFKRTALLIEIVIADDGIGIFQKIQNELGLDDQLHAILELAKGKLTTDPLHHTGEGIFFTSRVFDNFMIVSGKLLFVHNEADNDWLVEDREDLFQGTYVRLRINPTSARNLQDVFNRYTTGEDYGFTRTYIPVTLARYGDENLVSRSQAKRLLARYNRFKEIILDFKGVETIGQAFADEIFRVFYLQNPQIHLTYVNANEQVTKMILRTQNEL